MGVVETFESAKEVLERHGQGHILAFWPELDPIDRRNLLTQIQQLDFEKIDQWIANFVKKTPPPPDLTGLSPAPFCNACPRDPPGSLKYKQAIRLGRELISAGKVAALVVAGGQGTRLGFNGPKGNFPISPVSKKTFFQIFAETIATAGRKYKAACPWYVMTSPLNHAETVEIFRSNGYYGLNKEDVFIFQQGTMPAFGSDGKILLADKADIACSPDGHGGTLKALCKSGASRDMKRRGVEFISYFQLDNPLINIFDPLFIGLHALDQAEMSSKGVLKNDPREKVGNFCLVGGTLTVIEYPEFNKLGEEVVKKRNPDGSLAFLGSIGIHIINIGFVEGLNAEGILLPLHRAEKAIPHIDQHGNRLDPPKPNGVKLETFVFDALPFASKSVTLETLRDQEFAPTKNKTGVDSVKTTRQMMVARAADWLESAGIDIPRRPDGSADCLIEIAPSFALEKEDIRAKRGQIPKVKPKDKLYLM